MSSRIKLWERFFIPSYNNPNHVQCGEVSFDYEKCKRDSLCAIICPAKAIVVLEDKRPRMKDAVMSECMACGDCIAICPYGAITLQKPFRVIKGYFKTIDQGNISHPRMITLKEDAK